MIVDEVWVEPDLNESDPHSQPCEHGPNYWGHYSFCSQLIKWNDPDHPYYTIRLAYYRSRCREDRWEFASQMTVNADPLIVKVLCERTLAKQSWFQKEPSATALPQSK
jgi:hypothetical protein